MASIRRLSFDFTCPLFLLVHLQNIISKLEHQTPHNLIPTHPFYHLNFTLTSMDISLQIYCMIPVGKKKIPGVHSRAPLVQLVRTSLIKKQRGCFQSLAEKVSENTPETKVVVLVIIPRTWLPMDWPSQNQISFSLVAISCDTCGQVAALISSVVCCN